MTSTLGEPRVIRRQILEGKIALLQPSRSRFTNTGNSIEHLPNLRTISIRAARVNGRRPRALPQVAASARARGFKVTVTEISENDDVCVKPSRPVADACHSPADRADTRQAPRAAHGGGA
jgi:hypothetical protein